LPAMCIASLTKFPKFVVAYSAVGDN
jgi:hypothetical protein